MNYSQPTPPFLRKGRHQHITRSIKAAGDPLQGTIVLGRYRVNSRLSQGGMSTIYLARNFEQGGLFVIKILRPDICKDQGVHDRILYESQAVQRINHPAVIKILEVGKVNPEQVCLVMEYVHGASLRKMMNGNRLPLSKAIPILGAIAEGLQAAHAQGVIHRDLKPENVLIPRGSNTNSIIKVIDFGIARIIDAPSITTTQHVMGTPEYIAPEQAMGDKVDHRADVYAFGILMYEMLSGELPFHDDDPENLLNHHINTPPPTLTSYLPEMSEIPNKLIQLVMDCLHKNPNQRPSHMAQILDILRVV